MATIFVDTTYLHASQCDLGAFKALIEDTLHRADVPHASDIINNVPIYDTPTLADTLADTEKRKALMAEWAGVLMNRSGVVVLRRTYRDVSVIDEASEIFHNIIRDEKASQSTNADHFAPAGSNDRVWNSLQKLAQADPDVFTRYFANPALDAICESWLGPCYQLTAQVNLVYPGGQAQQPHRDYHMGFQTDDRTELFPAHVHALSPVLTLQGAIAHCEMNEENGVTQLLPFSQRYLPGYLAYRRDDFRDCFKQNYVQLPLAKGDTVFFNPALFHAAGDNKTTDENRLGNLLQVSSAYGRALENVDRTAMCRWVYPHLQKCVDADKFTSAEVNAVIAATAEGYSFPTNLDTDPPVGGLAPETQQELMNRCLDSNTSPDDFNRDLDALAGKRQA